MSISPLFRWPNSVCHFSHFTDILESDENGIIPEQARVITQVVILDADKKQIQCVVRPLQILRADGTWENIGGMK
ncbi:phage tail fiber C-terminal domain-containing protein [Escherichia albertii]|uniref:phage tail fiber C-terminal domain-containing protein n=1 Tax=Escherichia albertii TaxID=208962 RepID=UPI001F0CA14A|nr:phage tail fiber C-terminal domain-containing protein [Escherichia albertii]